MAHINSNFPGQNAYLHPSPCRPYGSCGDFWPQIVDSGVRFIRIGDKSYDKCLMNASQAPGTPDFQDFEDSGLFTHSFIPIVQLSYYQTPEEITNGTVTQAAQLWTSPSDAAAHLLEFVVRPLYN